MEVAQGNHTAEQAAKRAALQNYDLIGVATLVPQTNLSETASYTAEKATAPHSSTLAWKIPWTEEPVRLQSMGSLRVGHN